MNAEPIPKAPPISAPLVGMLTLTIPQSEPFGLQNGQGVHGRSLGTKGMKIPSNQKIPSKADRLPDFMNCFRDKLTQST